MTTENENQVIDFNDEAVAAVIEGDDHLRTLPLNSEDLRAAVAEKMSASETEEDGTSADAEDNEYDDEADDSEEDKPQEGVKKQQKGWSKRVGKLVAQNREKDQRIRELESKVQERAKEIVHQAVGDFDYDKPEPSFDDYDTVGEYSKAVARWEYGRMKAEEAYQSEVAATTKKVHDIQSSWEAKQQDARAVYGDFDDIVNIDTVQQANPSQLAKEFLAASDIGPTVFYTILSDPDLSEEFAQASSAAQVRMLAKLEISLEGDAPVSSAKPAAATKKTVKLPTPLPKGRPTSQSFDLVRDADRMSDEEWSKAFEAQRRK